MTSDKPNILVIMAESMGCWAMRCAGNPDIHTPNIDMLASDGIMFLNFFCVSPVSSPSVASLLTGRMPSNHGIHDHLLEVSLRNADGYAMDYLHDTLTYPEVLARNGYYCGLSGKWHLGDPTYPQKSFSHWYAMYPYEHNYHDARVMKDGHWRVEKNYITDAITDNALGFIDEHHENPFCLHVHYNAPHPPWDKKQHLKEDLALYKNSNFEYCPDLPVHPWQVGSFPRSIGRLRNDLIAGYYASITAMDRNIGRIIEKLDKLDIINNTLIFFTSTNGMNMGHHGIWGNGNGTYPLNMYDTSVKIPAIISLPGKIASSRIDRALLNHYDWRPTLLDYLGIADPDAQEMPGESFAPLLQGRDMADRDSLIIIDEYGPVRMIRERNWKYVHRYPDGPHELYYLAVDPDEVVNLVDNDCHKPRIDEMHSDIEKFFMDFSIPGLDGSELDVQGGGQLGAAAGDNAFAHHSHWVDDFGKPRDDDYVPSKD